MDALQALAANIEPLPACDHAKAIGSMQHFAIGLIPFKQNDSTASVDPVAHHEHHALGLPVITSRFGETAFREKESAAFLMDINAHLAESAPKVLS